MFVARSTPSFAPEGLGRWTYRSYLLSAALVPLAFFFLGLSGMASNWYLQQVTPALRNFGYASRAGAAHCDLVIYGDSSSLTGLDPQILQRETGLKTCNLSEGSTIQLFTGSDLPLQVYLRHNPPPRVLLGMWGYASYHPNLAPYTLYSNEGVIYMWRYGSRIRLVTAFLLHPRWILQFISSFSHDMQTIVKKRLIARKKPDAMDAQLQRDQRHGMWPYPLPPQTHCVRPDLTNQAASLDRDEASVTAFRRKYASAQTRVLVDVAPTPDCNPYFTRFAATLNGLHDNSFEKLPIRFFNEGDVHFSIEGSRYLSKQIAHQVRATLAEGPAPGQTLASSSSTKSQ